MCLMKHTHLVWLAVLIVASWPLSAPAGEAVRRLPVKEYRDKMKAGWIGQIIGVSWGAPTEFRFRTIMPPEKMPPFSEGLINDGFNQDDLYVEMTFLRSMEQHGFDVSIRQAGIDFANSRYDLWCANAAGRSNLRRGIAPPDSSHPKFHNCAGAIDYQIEADFAGLIAPGMPQVVIGLGEKFGRLMNYGDGVYAGQFMGAMYAEAFFETDPVRLIEAGLRAIPAQSLYAEMVRDMVRWRRENPTSWEKTWALAEKKYNQDRNYNISALDVKREGAWVLMGLLYGGGDLDQTMIISCRCGFDSDCNPSSSGGVLCTSRGMSRLPQRYYKRLNEKAIFSHTAYSFPGLINVCEKLARQALAKAGGRVERNAQGEEVFVIPVGTPRPSPFEDLKHPGPIAGSRYAPAEMAQIKAGLKYDLEEFAPGWTLANCGRDMDPGLKNRWGGKSKVFVTHPLDRKTGCTLSRTVAIPTGKHTTLRLLVGHHPQGDWLLLVRANGQEVLRQPIGKDTAEKCWAKAAVDLTPLAGKSVKLELVNQPTGWRNEAAYWASIAIESR
jgi:hypothetical protein